MTAGVPMFLRRVTRCDDRISERFLNAATGHVMESTTHGWSAANPEPW